jgi:hypothetical protein
VLLANTRFVARQIVGCFVALAVVGCRHDGAPERAAATCEGVRPALSGAYRTKGLALVGDVDADGNADSVTLRVDAERPARCRHLLVVEVEGGRTAATTVPPLAWPGTDPKLLMLVELNGRAGLEPAIAMASAAAVYVPGAVYTLSRGALLRLRLERQPAPDLFPFSDEFPSGVDCTGPPGAIVVTRSRIAEGDDRRWEVIRSFYRAAGTRFDFVRIERTQVAVGSEAERRWPEVRGVPFASCSRGVP